MTEEEYNRLFNRLLVGLPITLVMTRLSLALWSVIEAGGEPAAIAFRSFVRAKTEGEEDE